MKHKTFTLVLCALAALAGCRDAIGQADEQSMADAPEGGAGGSSADGIGEGDGLPWHPGGLEEAPDLPAGVPYAAPIVFQVTNYLDAVPAPAGSFRAALAAAAATPLANGDPHTINFATGSPGTINPVAPFVVGRWVTVKGNWLATFNSSTAVSNAVNGHTLFEVPATTRLWLSRLNILGRLQQRGVYVAPSGYFLATSVRISSFGQPLDHEPGVGGCVLCDGWEATSPTQCNFSGSAINNCSADWGGGLAAIGRAYVSFSHSDVSFNTAWQQGGGVFSMGALPAYSTLSVSKTSMRNNAAWYEGGAIRTIGVAFVSMASSTISDSYSYTDQARSLVVDSTPDLRIRESTIIAGGNGGGAALSIAYSSGFVANSILEKSSTAATATVCAFGAGNSLSFVTNLVRDASCGPAATPVTGLLPMITAPCGVYAPAGVGGCKVHPIASTSAARNSGNAGYCGINSGGEADQRQYLRQNGCDIGAYEYDGLPP